MGERLAWLATAAMGVLWMLAFVEMLRGNETAINGVVGAGFGVVVFGCLAWMIRRGKI